MRVRKYIYNSETADDHVAWVLEQLKDRTETVEYINLGSADDRETARREAMLTVGQATRVGGKPSGIFDDDGNPDFSTGVMITEEAQGRRDIRIGTEAVEVLQPGDMDPTDSE